ncbi:MAG: cytidine deaminase [Clostridiales bacterium]|nr:cytidine deaminase [Clostridiales bacterium]
MKLLWQIDTAVEPSWLSLMQTAADCALLMEGVTRPCAVSIRLCGDEEIHEINREYRSVDRATDVLSFPTVNYPCGVTAGQADKLLRRELDDELDACMLGDLILSVPHVLAQAEEYGHSPEREAAYLIVHGLCHLMGYDHIEEDDKRRMRAMEEKILSAIGQTREGTASVSDETLLALAKKAMERSYSPYSGYAVGAALLCADGRIFQGCNIENASFGLTNCAERTAMFKAISEGAEEFTAIAIAASGSAPWPCGACRQVLNEFAPGIRVLVTWDGNTDEASLDQLLPHGFGPKSLQ